MINQNSYYTVQAWMVNDLGLHGNELALYAIIYGFSQDGRSAFTGSISYIQEWLGCSRNTVKRTISNLEEKNLIIKKESKNGVDTNIYRARLDLINQGGQKLTPGGSKIDPGGVQNLQEGGPKLTGGGPKIDPNNYIDNYLDNYIDKESSAGGAPPTSSESENDKKPVKHKYGEYKNVLLTDEELDKLREKFPQDWRQRIERLSEYVASTGKKYKSHYATIRSWANNDRQKRPARPSGRGGYAGQVGPNGIAIDPTKNDLDGLL